MTNNASVLIDMYNYLACVIDESIEGVTEKIACCVLLVEG
jgi:uncharacterized protein YlzI (FlbEa/FlbD family)